MLDPPPGLTGKIGGLHLKRRTQDGQPGFVLVLSVGYAFQKSDDEEKRQSFGRICNVFIRLGEPGLST